MEHDELTLPKNPPLLTEQARAWIKLVQEIRACREPLAEEFDQIMTERVNLRQELSL